MTKFKESKVREIIEKYGRYWVEADGNLWSDLFSANAEYRCHPVIKEKWYKGRSAISGYFNTFVVNASNKKVQFYHHVDKMNWNPSKRQVNFKMEAKITKKGNRPALFLIIHAIAQFKDENDPFRISYFEEISNSKQWFPSKEFKADMKGQSTEFLFPPNVKAQSGLKKSVGKTQKLYTSGFKKKNPYMQKEALFPNQKQGGKSKKKGNKGWKNKNRRKGWKKNY